MGGGSSWQKIGDEGHSLLGRKILIGSIQIAGGQGAIQALSFVRNLVIARIIGPEQFGLALTLVLVLSLVEMAAETSADKFIVQDAEGDDKRVQSTLHLFMFIRGIAFAVLLLLGADLIVRFFGVPEDIAWAYRVLGAATVCTGLLHLDVKRFHREMRYHPDMVADVAGNAVAFIVGVFLAWTLGDFRAMLYAILARFATMAAVSHLFADRPYRIWLSTDVAGRVWRFAWPLMINGLVLFIANQGDRALIGRAFGMEVLGIFGAAALVVQAVGIIILKVVSSIGLSFLSARKHDAGDYDVAYHRFGSVVALAAVVFAVPLIVVLPHVIPMAFGDDYDVPRALVTLLVVALALKIFRSWATMGALALGASQAVMISNVLRSSGFGIAFVVIALGGSVVDVAASQVVAEVIASMAIYMQLKWGHDIRLGRAAVFFAIVVGVTGACLSVDGLVAQTDMALALSIYAAILLAGVAALYAASPEIRGLTRVLGGALWRPTAKV